jgi:hypothetical protein
LPAAEQNVIEHLVQVLSAVWQEIRTHHPDVPDAAMIVGSGTTGRRHTVRLGHFATSRWRVEAATPPSPTAVVGTADEVNATASAVPTTAVVPAEPAELHEVFLSGEGLRRGAAQVLATLLHEAAHGLATAREISDTSGGGRFHNLQYKRLATELGLVVAKDGARGWSATTLGAAAEQRYAGALDRLAEATRVYRVDERPARTGGQGNLAVAECACPRKIRVARTTLAQAPITCGACDTEFTIRE